MKRTLLLMFAAIGLAFVISAAQTRNNNARKSEQEIVTDRTAPEPPAPPTPPALEAPLPPAAPAPPPPPASFEDRMKAEKPGIPQPPKAPVAPKVMIKIKGC